MGTSVVAVAGLDEGPRFASLGKPPNGANLAEKLGHLRQQASGVASSFVSLYGVPRAVAVERQIGKFIKPHSHYAAGVMLLALHEQFLAYGWEVPLLEVSTPTWKKRTVGKGNAGKPEVMAWALTQVPPGTVLTQDQADAIGIAESTRLDENLT